MKKNNITYFQLGKKNSNNRLKRHMFAQRKWQRVARVAKILSFVPTVVLIGVTGGLAMDNAKKEDDIDLFFIITSGTLWSTRLILTVLTELLGIRRRPDEKHIANKICLNMYMVSNALTLPSKDQDLFAAHEVLQMKPVFERGDIYKKFLIANRWVKTFLPNAWNMRQVTSDKRQVKHGEHFFIALFHVSCLMLLRLLEPIAKLIQLAYMKKRRTTEVISDSILRFHPFDARTYIKRELGKRLARFNLPLDKIFYDR